MIVGGSEALIEDLGLLERNLSQFGRQPRHAAYSTFKFRHPLLRKPGRAGLPASGRPAGRTSHRTATPPSPSYAPPNTAPTSRLSPPPVPPASFAAANRWLLAGLIQAPILAFLIVAIFGREATAAVTEANGASVAQALAATIFALAVAAGWLGCSIAVAELAQAPGPAATQQPAWTRS